MPKMIFVNLAVKDLPASIAFYEAIGCEKNDRFSGDHAAMMVWSETISFMLLTHGFFAGFTSKPIADAHGSSEVLIALSRDSREEVDSITEAAARSGGRIDVRERQDMASCIRGRSRIPTATSSSRCGWTSRRRRRR